MKRKLSLLLCAALTLSLLAGCGPKNTGNGSASGSDSTSQSTSQNTEDRTQGVQFKLVNTVKQGEAAWQTVYFGATHLPDAQLCKEELL